MAKAKTKWVCQECGFTTTRFLGRCTECDTWNSLVEELQISTEGGPKYRQSSGFVSSGEGPQPLDAIEMSDHDRILTGMDSVDEVLGGGLVPGSVILLAGDPGVGKSTFLLQAANELAKNNRVLYVSAEESAKQVKMRASRLGVVTKDLLVDSEQNILTIQNHMQNSGIKFAVIDSVQAVFHPEVTSAPGSVSQVRESAAALVSAAKANGICVVIVGHVTKDGSIAGPRVLEHMVDVVLHFEGDSRRHLRVLRAMKNRFGSTHEIALFTMSEGGLQEVDNASELLLGDRLAKAPGERAPSGTAVLAAAEGNRSLLIEVQALASLSLSNTPRRVANGLDFNRLLLVLAVLEKRVGLLLAKQDVYVNIVGGLEFDDPAGDLGVAIAVATSCLDRSVDPFLVAVGEIGLSGEVRPVPSLERRLKEASRMGFKKAIVPKANLPLDGKFDQLEILGVEYLVDALEAVMPAFGTSRKRAQQQAEAEAAERNQKPQASSNQRTQARVESSPTEVFEEEDAISLLR